MEIKLGKESNNIKSMFYLQNKLHVFFNSNSYYVYEIDKNIAKELQDSEDKTKFFYSKIREKVSYKRIY